MKRSGILHGELSRLVASLGHGDLLVVGDAGLPAPAGVPVVDLALKPGVPSFVETVQVILGELVVEKGFANAEQPEVSPDAAAELERLWLGRGSFRASFARSVERDVVKSQSDCAHRRIHTVLQPHPRGGCAFLTPLFASGTF